MNCPICGEKSKVLNCAKDCEAVFRKRGCVICGHIWYTEEYEVKNVEVCKNHINNRIKNK